MLPRDRYRQKRRYRPGTKALLEIRRLQKAVNLLIPKAPFGRVVKELVDEYASEGRRDLRVSREAMGALHEVRTRLFACCACSSDFRTAH